MRAAVFNDTRAGGHYGCDLVMLELFRRLNEKNISVVWSSYVGEDWRQREDFPDEVDLIIVNGEGSIHHSATHPRAASLASVGPFARAKNITPYLVNSTMSDLEPAVLDDLRSFELIGVRERQTQHYLEQHGLSSIVTPDLTVMAPLSRANARSGVCGTDSVVPEAQAAVERRCNAEGWPIHAIKWTKNTDEALSVDSHTRRAGVQQFANKLSGCSLVVTGRFHVVTMCIATETPFVAVESNTPKISAYLNDLFGSTERLLTPAEIESADLSRYAAWRPRELRSVAAGVESGEAAVNKLFERIAFKP